MTDFVERDSFVRDEVFGRRLLISNSADFRELKSNTRAARAILNSFYGVSILINGNYYERMRKNPEYTINGYPGDRKGIMSEKGITAGFKSAKKQGCKYVVIDLDEHIGQVRTHELSKYISRRKKDFENGEIYGCFVVFGNKAVLVNAAVQPRDEIAGLIEQLKPQKDCG